MRKVTLVISVLMLLVAVGCEETKVATSTQPAVVAPDSQQRVAATPHEAPAAEHAPTPAQQGAVLAYVNGNAIYMAPLIDMVVAAKGMEAAQHLIASELVLQAAAEKGLVATDEEIKVEHDKTLAQIFRNTQDLAQREDMLGPMLRQRGMSKEQWDVTMRRNVLLTQLVLPDVEVSDEEVANLYEDKYGRKLIARHIVADTAADAQVAIDRVKNGENFETVMKEVSKSPSAARGGLFPAIGAQSRTLPPPLKDAVLALKAVGDMSDAIMFQKKFYILYLDSIVEAQDVKLEDVKEELVAGITDGKLGSARQRKLGDMINNAKIDYVNPILKEKQNVKDAALAEQERRQAELKKSQEEAKKYAEKMLADKAAAGEAEPKTSKEDARKYAEKMIAEKEAAAKEAAADEK